MKLILSICNSMNHSTTMYRVKNIIYRTVRRLDHYEDKEEIINMQFMNIYIDEGISCFSEKKSLRL